MSREHHYSLSMTWTGNLGEGTSSHRSFSRDHTVDHPDAGTILASSDPAFRGDPSRWNPEQLLVASLAQCHMLWYLHLAAQSGLVVVAYEDAPTGTMVENKDGSGHFSEVTLHPTVTIAEGNDADLAKALHGQIGGYCFIARSVNFPVLHRPTITIR